MIVECPKCKTKFEINDSLIKSSEMKFQCSECAFVWNQSLQKTISDLVENNPSSFEEEKLPSCLVDNKVQNDKSNLLKDILNPKNIMICILAIILFTIIFVVIKNISYSSIDENQQSIFDEQKIKADLSKDLYIEISKPLTLIKEGANNYIIIRGFIYNPSKVNTMSIPKLVIRLENLDGRVLQEQEREVEVKQLAPLEKTDFMFKVFQFSSQVARVKVEFVEPGKI